MTPEHSKSTAGARGAPDSLGDRAGVLLKGLVECYLVDGQPVGSKYLSSSSGLGLSPATVRSILAELEHHGFLTSPHTSAGRVPTPRGMRHFVDSLLTVESQPVQAADRLQSDLTAATAESGKLAVAGDWLAEMSHLVGLVRAPRSDCHRLRQVEFVDLGAGHILAVLVTWEGEVHNKLIQPETPCSPGQLEQAANFLNREFVGKTLDVIRSQLLQEITRLRHAVDEALNRVLLAAQALPERRDDVLVRGESNLVASPDLADRAKLSTLFSAFEEKSDLLDLFDQCLNVDAVEIFIGAESGFSFLDDCSAIAAPYHHDGEVVGVLGVIGPTRMPYGLLVPMVGLSARMLSAALNRQL